MPGFARSPSADEPCPCGGGRYDSCCGPFHRGEALPETAEQLMRSRYSAYSRSLIDYLLRTHPSETPSAQRRQELKASCRGVRWTGLRIVAAEAGGPSDLTGTVTFEARYRTGTQTGLLQECSRFGREGQELAGRWLYLAAETISA
ncbi:MAG: YchJ family protein [Vulcanococcus sp.]